MHVPAIDVAPLAVSFSPLVDAAPVFDSALVDVDDVSVAGSVLLDDDDDDAATAAGVAEPAAAAATCFSGSGGDIDIGGSITDVTLIVAYEKQAFGEQNNSERSDCRFTFSASVPNTSITLRPRGVNDIRPNERKGRCASSTHRV
jgi:hypothetical protein